jgi:hypothetical protein
MAEGSSLLNLQHMRRVIAEPEKGEMRMKTSRQLGWQSSVLGAAAIVALSLTLGLTPRTARADVCTGDCDGSGDVTVNEIIILVNMALGTQTQLSACPHGLPADITDPSQVDVSLIIKAVNAALSGCPAPGTPTPSPTPSGSPVCGNGVTDPGEECDDGGTCIGGTNAGTACTAESDCHGNGVCEGGVNQFRACADNSGCPSGKCTHCKTFGGDGCAANCTHEKDVLMTLKQGVVQGLDIKAGTSGAVVHGDILTIPLPLSGTQTITIGGKGADGHVPAVIKAASIQFPKIPVSTIACACLRGVAAKTCGGTLYDIDGVTLSTDCTADFTAGDSVCPVDKPCAFLHGPANAASGNVGCGPDGYTPVDVLFDLDSGGSTGIAGKPIITLSGSGATGSGLLLSNNAIGTVTGLCTGNDTSVYGPDKVLCTDDDPQGSRGTPSPQLNITGTATGKIENANGTDGDDLGGPFMVSGNPIACDALLGSTPSVAGGGLAGAFVSLNAPVLGDIIVTSDLVGQ